jgi:H+/gluconate symporter-like permease
MPNNNIRIIKNALKIDSSSSSKSEHNTNSSTPDNSNNSENLTKKLMSVKTVIVSIILMSLVLALQEALTFEEEGNKMIHYFSDSEALFKCEGGFYSGGQILALKDIELDWIWVMMILLVIGLTISFNLYMSDRSNPNITSWYSIPG